MAKAKNPGLYRAIHKLKHGGLHDALNIPRDQKIPESKIAAAKNSKNSHISKMANFASVMSGFKHSGPKSKKK
jgi:hypothetical protein